MLVHKPSRTIYTLYLFTCVFILFLLPLSAYSKMLTISGDNVNIRKGPGQKYQILYKVGQGYPVIEMDKKGKWYKIKDFEQDAGWVHQSLVNDSPQLIVKVNKESDETINIRQNPSMNGEIIGQAHYGVVFKKIGEKDGWAHVEHSSGLRGWIKRNLLWGY